MLRSLYIKNYAIIDEIRLAFDPGFTVLTGETGAGKSILVGALSLIAGDRADVSVVRDATSKCIVEAVFDISDTGPAQTFLQNSDLDMSDELIIRREISVQGKSRIFINDSPSTLQVLSGLCELLLDLHRQFDTRELQYHTRQLQLLDTLAGNQELLLQLEKEYSAWKKSEKEWKELVEKNRALRQELDYNQFVFGEIDQLQLKEGEIEQLETEIHVLQHSENYKQHLRQLVQLLFEQDQAAVPLLKQGIQILEPYAGLIKNVAAMHDRLRSAYIDLNDLKNELEQAYETADYDEEKIQTLNERLDECNRLLKKHAARDTEQLLRIRDEFELRIQNALQADEREQSVEMECRNKEMHCNAIALKLHDARKKQAPRIEKHVNELLKRVGMPNARIGVDIEEIAINRMGKDKLEFLFDANKTGQMKPISKIASGGELSRLMLCIKSMLAGTTGLPTLIFDEIDTGISGETAIQVGKLMKDLSQLHQVISITHLPQIAGKAQHHIYISKEESSDGMRTQARQLQQEERVEILAEMLSGKNSSQQARQTVRDLMNS